jgi:hypothetical protein
MRLFRRWRLSVFVRKRWRLGRVRRMSTARIVRQPDLSKEQLDMMARLGTLSDPPKSRPARLLHTEWHLGFVELRWTARR